MAALVAVAGIDTGADEAVTDVKAGTKGGFHNGAVVGIDIHRVIGICLSQSGGLFQVEESQRL